ncbi:hypothetical protein VC83_03944 [Pseudogymnoascus destructans]|uniref:Retrovirus-related Pol polyprotein from transposon TNT 1-94-like beta-barrel domain-containing protein n=1 Tax=Pseudogymnoascus destructans TaxID=655981 RepID=A0A177AC49_9PEZI|nr:uncharacterized protein VC83_03944 [Pseudogymnoascus destructans]OAF59657.1 hypothetical protein VC83_03944 [Pseudogymnoascus destructans]
MKSKRTKSWKPNRDIEAKVDAYISEKPGFQYCIQRAIDQDKANGGQPRMNQDLPVSFATAFQVTQGLTLSTYELARSTILDSGATIHVCNDRTRFYNLKECEDGNYLLAGDQKVRIEGFGSVDIKVQVGKDTKSVRTITLQETALVSSFHTSVASLNDSSKRESIGIQLQKDSRTKESRSATLQLSMDNGSLNILRITIQKSFKNTALSTTRAVFGGPRRRPGPHIPALSLPPTPLRIPSSTPQSRGPNESAIVRESKQLLQVLALRMRPILI